MSEIIGHIISRSSGIMYQVKLDPNEKIVWVSSNGTAWILVCQKVEGESMAIQCAQKFIDLQEDLF